MSVSASDVDWSPCFCGEGWFSFERLVSNVQYAVTFVIACVWAELSKAVLLRARLSLACDPIELLAGYSEKGDPIVLGRPYGLSYLILRYKRLSREFGELRDAFRKAFWRALEATRPQRPTTQKLNFTHLTLTSRVPVMSY